MAINLSLILVQKLRFLLRGVKSGDSAFYPLFFLYFFQKNSVKFALEKCQSGRMGLTRNHVYGQLYRGFESLFLRFLMPILSFE